MKLRSITRGFALAVLLTGCTASNPLDVRRKKADEYLSKVFQWEPGKK